MGQSGSFKTQVCEVKKRQLARQKSHYTILFLVINYLVVLHFGFLKHSLIFALHDSASADFFTLQHSASVTSRHHIASQQI